VDGQALAGGGLARVFYAPGVFSVFGVFGVFILQPSAALVDQLDRFAPSSVAT